MRDTATPKPRPMTTSTPVPGPILTPGPTPTVIVAGLVFDDRDGDGTQDPDEPGVAGVPVVLDDQVVDATDANGRFNLPLSGPGQALLSIVPPEGWEWPGEPLTAKELLTMGEIAIPLRQVQEMPPLPTAVTLIGSMAVVMFLVGLAFNGFASLAQAAAVRSLERTYRRQKSQELELQQYRLVAQRQEELKKVLAQTGGWREVLKQVIADALPDEGTNLLSLGNGSATPAPHFVALGDKREYVFTVSPDALRERGLFRRDRVIPLDASLSPTVRVEVQAVWQHLVDRHSPDSRALPRRAEWFLVVRRRRERERLNISVANGLSRFLRQLHHKR